MSNPQISVIICTYNRSQTLKNVLEDLIEQEFREDKFSWEIVIVDNNSTDDTVELVKSYETLGQITIRYEFEPRQGKSFALNHGIRHSRGELLVFTDDDVRLDAAWLSSVYKAFKEHSHNCFGGRVIPILDGVLPDWLADNGPYAIPGGPIVKHDGGEVAKEYDRNMHFPVGSNMFLRKQVFEKYGYFSKELGYYDNNTLIYGEDSELMYRMQSQGEAILYYPQALVYHPISAARLTKSYFKKFFWGTGRGNARWARIPEQSVLYCNVPRFIIKETTKTFMRLLLAMLSHNKYKRFFFELHFIHGLGKIYEFYISGE